MAADGQWGEERGRKGGGSAGNQQRQRWRRLIQARAVGAVGAWNPNRPGHQAFNRLPGLNAGLSRDRPCLLSGAHVGAGLDGPFSSHGPNGIYF